jgi:hypothetical protein
MFYLRKSSYEPPGTIIFTDEGNKKTACPETGGRSFVVPQATMTY